MSADLKYPLKIRKGKTGFCACCNNVGENMYEGYEKYYDDVIPCDICEECKDIILEFKNK